ncbi:MAG TPA: hypothetical protein VLB46_12815 [Pyrinomonadaceae bacterium]|nr:hypothetical protein [Pyrinomonadaceae bacterium]
MKPQEQLENVGSKLPDKVKELEAQLVPSSTGAPEVAAIPNAFTGFALYRTHGLVRLTAISGAINGNSRVLVGISEFGGTPQGRFIGSAKMTIHNIAPFNGGVQVLADIAWGSDLNVRLDAFVDP